MEIEDEQKHIEEIANLYDVPFDMLLEFLKQKKFPAELYKLYVTSDDYHLDKRINESLATYLAAVLDMIGSVTLERNFDESFPYLYAPRLSFEVGSEPLFMTDLMQEMTEIWKPSAQPVQAVTAWRSLAVLGIVAPYLRRLQRSAILILHGRRGLAKRLRTNFDHLNDVDACNVLCRLLSSQDVNELVFDEFPFFPIRAVPQFKLEDGKSVLPKFLYHQPELCLQRRTPSEYVRMIAAQISYALTMFEDEIEPSMLGLFWNIESVKYCLDVYGDDYLNYIPARAKREYSRFVINYSS